MSLAYVVRCNFNQPDKEQAWNDWYSGPKLRQMLEKPFFLTGQRFRKRAGEGRDYLAFWTLASEEAFTTPEYTNDWGFFEWKPYIIDWSRDLFESEAGEVSAPELREGQVLRLISFEGLGAEEAEAARAAIDRARPGSTWLKIVGLDRHTPLLGLSVENRAEEKAAAAGAPGAKVAFYEPISVLARSPASASAKA